MHTFLIILITVLKCCSSQDDMECVQFSTCETCAGIINRGVSCRWCLSSNSCVPSKYMCHPWKTVLHYVNCPIRELPTTYNDTFERNEIAYYILAANRVSHYAPVGAPMSCLLKINSKIELLHEIELDFPLDGTDVGYLIGVNHDRMHIFIGFRATNCPTQILFQVLNYLLVWMEDFPLGGKMLAYYNEIYKLITDNGFDKNLNMAIKKFPNYSIVLVGHSLGGAMATIFSLHVAMRHPRKQVSLHSWSAPRSGDETFVNVLKYYVFEEFRVTHKGDFIPDMPLRNSQTFPLPHHNSFEIFYQSHMTNETYQICDQPESEHCLKGSWLKWPRSHGSLFDKSFFNLYLFLGYC